MFLCYQVSNSLSLRTVFMESQTWTIPLEYNFPTVLKFFRYMVACVKPGNFPTPGHLLSLGPLSQCHWARRIREGHMEKINPPSGFGLWCFWFSYHWKSPKHDWPHLMLFFIFRFVRWEAKKVTPYLLHATAAWARWPVTSVGLRYASPRSQATFPSPVTWLPLVSPSGSFPTDTSISEEESDLGLFGFFVPQASQENQSLTQFFTTVLVVRSVILFFWSAPEIT